MSETPDLPEVTGELLAGMEWRYSDPRACRVCGMPLELVDSRDMKMACPSGAASPFRRDQEAAGVTSGQAMTHYSESTLWNPPPGDARVLALVAEVRRLRKEAGNGNG